MTLPTDPGTDVLIPIYVGLTPLAEMLREELAARGIGSVVRLVEPDVALLAEMGTPRVEQVLISARDRVQRDLEVEECLALVAVPEDAE